MRRRWHMSDKVNYKRTAAVWEHSKASGSTLLLLLAIARHADDNGAAWPGHATLARHLRETKRSVIKQIQSAEELGELVVFRRPGKNNVYILDVGLTDEQRKTAHNRLLLKFPDLPQVVNQRSPVPVNQSSLVVDGAPDQDGGELVNQRSPGSEPAFTSTSEPEFTRKIIRRDQEEQDSPPADADAPAPETQQYSETTVDPPRPLSDQQRMFEAICEAWGYEPSAVTDTLRGLIGKVAKELVKVKADPGDMHSLKGYLDQRARQKQWSDYTVASMSKYWTDFLDDRARGYKPAKHPPMTLRERMFKAKMFRQLASEGKQQEALALDYWTVKRAMKEAGADS